MAGSVSYLLVWFGRFPTVNRHHVQPYQKSLIQCNFVVPKSLSDRDGNWRVGAITTLIDLIGASVIHTIHGNIHVSVDFNISFFSTVKVQEEVEIEAKVLGDQ
ncbi:hypothetical protein C5167_029672 [Papaver somniferum]|nr:hypothetical protein C5167_029672 [Papaver somniferum]